MRSELILIFLLQGCVTPKKVAPAPKEQELVVPFKRVRLAEKLCKKNNGLKQFKKDSFSCVNGAEFRNR